jgi:hypothetical protein
MMGEFAVIVIAVCVQPNYAQQFVGRFLDRDKRHGARAGANFESGGRGFESLRARDNTQHDGASDVASS